MDGDPKVESLDSFSLAFPLPYRVGFIVVLGLSCGLCLFNQCLISFLSCLGVGRQPSLPPPSTNRRADLDTIPAANIADTTPTPRINIPTSHSPVYTVCVLAMQLLAADARQPRARHRIRLGSYAVSRQHRHLLPSTS